MALPSGLRLGPYEIRAPLGAGGMGEVYEATDTRLDRVVAVKVVRAELAGDADRRARFLREARAGAGLTHPHICPLYDVGEAQIPGSPHPVDFLVMERLTGQNLAERLAAGPMPLGEAIACARQIAAALDHAHRQGLVHRDLKPANIMLTPSGARLLDFGLARLRAETGSAVADPTRTSLTADGVVLGTIQYSAPEQLEGREVDQRVDLFAFGAILYEMVTGHRAFAGGSPAAVISAIIGGTVPRLRDAAPLTPPSLDRIVTTCLAKDPEERWWSAHDIALLLQQMDDATDPAVPVPSATRPASWLGWSIAGLTIAAAAAIAMWGGSPDRSRPDREVLAIVPPVDVMLTQGEAPEVSPDGRQIAIVGTDASGRTRLYVRARDASTWRTLEDTDDAAMPFWKPDSQSLGFFGGGWLHSVSTGGGRPQRLAPAGVPRGGTWNQHGQILYVPAPNLPPQLIAEGGGTPTPVPVTTNPIPGRWFPQFLPDGQRYIFLSTRDRQGRIVRVGSLDSSDVRDVVVTHASARYASSGHLLYRRDQSLVAQVFDPVQGTLAGAPVVVSESVAYNPISYQALFSTSSDQRLAYVGEERGWQLVWFDADGRETALPPSPGGHSSACVSGDGGRVVFDLADSRSAAVDIWSLALADSATAPLTFDPAVDFVVVCSPTGDDVVFSSLRAGVPQMFRASLRAPGSESMLVPDTVPNLASHWSRDNRFIVYSRLTARTGWDIWVLPLDGGAPSAYLETSANERLAKLSPDGKWMAYLSDQGGRDEVFVRPFPATDTRWQVSQGGARQLVWHPDGHQLFYVSRDRKLIAVNFRAAGAGLSVGASRVVADTHAGGFERSTMPMAVGRDGRVLLGTSREGVQPVTVILNWQAARADQE